MRPTWVMLSENFSTRKTYLTFVELNQCVCVYACVCSTQCYLTLRAACVLGADRPAGGAACGRAPG